MGNLINHEAALSHATIQPAWVRITHWINALAVVLMVASGWQVYDASPIFPVLRFKQRRAGAQQKHFLFLRKRACDVALSSLKGQRRQLRRPGP